MVLRHFHLREQPFGVTPDPRFLCATATHREALAALLYGIDSGLGFMSLIASPGMGKTSTLFEALARLGDSVRTVFLFQSIQTPVDLFRALLIDLGEKDPPGNVVALETRLNEILVEQSETGKRLVLVVDEAQNLDFAVLEAIRMLSNFETPCRKLIQIVLCGQLQLADRLAEPDLLQLRQRISIFACLNTLTAAEVASYIQHRLKIAGYTGEKPLFTRDAVALIARYSGGIPRNINNLCFNALTIGCALGKGTIDAGVIREAIGDLKVQKVEPSDQITISEAATTEGRLGRRLFERESRPGWRVAGIAWALLVVFAVCGFALTKSGLLGAYKTHFGGTAAGAAPHATDAKQNGPAAQPSIEARTRPEAAAIPQQTAESTPVADPAQTSSQPDPAPASPPPVSNPAADPAKSAQPVQAADAARSTQAPRAHGRKASRTKKAELYHGGPSISADKVQLVRAEKTESINELCAKKFGLCRPWLVRRIIQLNPQILDPNHV